MRCWLTQITLLAVLLCSAGNAVAGAVGERHLVATNDSAKLRDDAHRDEVRVTLWYPALDGSVEQRIDLGPPANPLFRVASVSPDAGFEDELPRPVILFSHGYGGTARMMGWFGVPMARAGYIVIAVDHPGNNGIDTMTAPGAVLFWDRALDLRSALDAAKADPIIGPHLDLNRVGVAGFSAGGFTALVAIGARVDPDLLFEFCREHPTDGICLPQKEFALTMDDAMQTLARPELAAEVARAGDDHSIPEVRAAFAIAPAIVQALKPDSLDRITKPLAIVLGDADPVAPPQTNGLVVARRVPSAMLKVLPGVGHYDFLSTCAPAAVSAKVAFCPTAALQDETHQETIDMAIRVFSEALD